MIGYHLGDFRNGSIATDRWAPKIARCPAFPESDAKSEPRQSVAKGHGVGTVKPQPPAMMVARFYRACVGARPPRTYRNQTGRAWGVLLSL
jgi:hypothetical protein